MSQFNHFLAGFYVPNSQHASCEGSDKLALVFTLTLKRRRHWVTLSLEIRLLSFIFPWPRCNCTAVQRKNRIRAKILESASAFSLTMHTKLVFNASHRNNRILQTKVLTWYFMFFILCYCHIKLIWCVFNTGESLSLGWASSFCAFIIQAFASFWKSQMFLDHHSDDGLRCVLSCRCSWPRFEPQCEGCVLLTQQGIWRTARVCSMFNTTPAAFAVWMAPLALMVYKKINK